MAAGSRRWVSTLVRQEHPGGRRATGSRELLLVVARDEGRATEAEMWQLTPGRRNSVRPLALEVGASPGGGGWSAGEPRPGGRRRRASAREVAALGG